ncbi:MAG: hypothetical protein QHC78_07960 [Pigmentiphaga sp.]|uniref:hypothetical protein n=1 Tax=Pigmentiphaga sp. TaxID=1977564 RepID=UPI0029B053C4|nr:hypothetical protein [Pigmentiphaga sp.]MDX3905608.1 hypothetical protein [Pigmentiphaga sp.]
MTGSIQERIDAAITRVDSALGAHQMRANAPLSPKLLTKLKAELIAMRGAVERRDHVPAYPRALIDWPGDEQFVQEMVSLAYDYKRGIN